MIPVIFTGSIHGYSPTRVCFHDDLMPEFEGSTMPILPTVFLDQHAGGIGTLHRVADDVISTGSGDTRKGTYCTKPGQKGEPFCDVNTCLRVSAYRNRWYRSRKWRESSI